jgi:hypothetical protein
MQSGVEGCQLLELNLSFCGLVDHSFLPQQQDVKGAWCSGNWYPDGGLALCGGSACGIKCCGATECVPLGEEDGPRTMVQMAWSDLLAEWLSCNPPLESLNLSHNRLSAGTGWAIATALESNGSLNHLDLSFNPLTTDGVLLLLDGLRRNHRLVYAHS